MFKKKKGSTLVTVLAVAVVFMTIALAIITSIMGTMKTNTNQKVTEDLRYAAEAGLEIAKSQFAKGKMTIDTRRGEDDKLDDVLKSDTVERVEIFMDKVNEKEVVKSIAYGKNNNEQEMIMTQYKKNEMNNSKTSIFDHGIVAGKGGINLESKGAIAIQESSISSGNGVNSIGNIEKPNHIENDIKNVNFKNYGNPEKVVMLQNGLVNDSDGYNILGFDFVKETNKNKYEEIKVTKIKMSLNSTYQNPNWVMGKLTVLDEKGIALNTDPFEYLKKIDKESVTVIEIQGIHNSRKLNIIFVNSKEFEINLKTGLSIVDTVVVAKGDIKVQSEKGVSGNVLDLSSSTLFGESVSIIEGSSVKISHQPAKNNGHGFLSKEEEDKLNELLGVLVVGFGNNNETGTGSSESIEMIDNTFSN
ncbi:MAG: hypothetical protein ACRC30_03685 [Clostridium sp.]